LVGIQNSREWKDKRVLVVGLSRSGVSAACLLDEVGAKVLGTDSAPEDSLGREIEVLRERGIDFETGRHSLELLHEVDSVVVSPGVPLDIPLLVQARRMELEILGELELGYRLFPGKIIAVTGTNGKSTAVRLVYEMLVAASCPAFLAGNIGQSFTGQLLSCREVDWAVLEVSSFQLETIHRFRPHIGVVLNITPDHLDRHGDFENYRRLKSRLMENQTPDDWILLNRDDPASAPLFRAARARIVPFAVSSSLDSGLFLNGDLLVSRLDGVEQVLVNRSRLSLKGTFNVSNSLAVAGCALLAGVSANLVAQVLSSFPGLEHRLEFVRTVDGVSYYNDSKATNIDATVKALESFTEPVVVIMGGRNKGGDFRALVPALRRHAVAAVLLGESAERMERDIGGQLTCYRARSMAEAVKIAGGAAKPGQVVLLSPACASFDMFGNYEERGKAFKDEVAKIG